MNDKWYVVKLITNMAGQDADPAGTVFKDRTQALVNYHNTLAAFHNASDVMYAVVELQSYNGNVEMKEIVDHIPAPEPEPEPEPEEPIEE